MTTIRTTRLTLLSLVALGLCGLTLFLFPVVSPAAPTISWNPQKVSETIAQGESINIPVSLRAGENLTNVTFRVVPEISPYVSVTPASIASIGKDDETVVVTLSFSPAEDAPVDTFDGTVHVRAGTSARTYAKPLPVSVTILEKLPSSVEPDPDMVVTDPKGGIYPVNQLLMLLLDGVARTDAEEIAESVNGRLVGFIPEINIYQLEVPTTTIPELNSLITSLEGDTRITSAFTNNIMEPQSLFPTDLENLWKQQPSYTAAYDKIKIRKAWDRIEENPHTEDRRVVVGIADTKIACKHKEFDDVFIIDKDVSCSEKLFNEFHGTAMAGIIGASNLTSDTVPIPPDSDQMNGILSGFSKSNYALRRTREKVSGVEDLFIFQMSLWGSIIGQCDLEQSDRPHVVNMSMKVKMNFDISSPWPPFDSPAESWEKVFGACKQTLFVAAAGNDGVDASNNLPGGGIKADNLITVGATNLSDGRFISELEPSNYGDSVDIAAPGEKVYAPTVKEGVYNYSYVGKTSAATAMVSGVAAMLISIDPVQRNPEDIPQYIKQVLLDTADEIHPDTQLGCKEKGWEGCRLNAERAVCAVLGCQVNTAPTAVDDVATTQSGVAVDINVLENDPPDPDGDELTIKEVTDVANGSLAFTATSVTYTPNADFVGTDTFEYTIWDGNNGGTDTAKVTVTVTAVPICDIGNPILPCELGSTTYDTFAGNYTQNRSFYRANSYDVSISNGHLCLTLKDGLPHTEGYAYLPNFFPTVWTSPPPYNVDFGIFGPNGQFNGSCILQDDSFSWIGVGAATAVFSFDPQSVSVNENAGTITFTLSRSDDTAEATVYVSTLQNQGFTNNGDHVGLANEAVNFAAGDPDEPVTITINDDFEIEDDETFGLIVQQSPSDPVNIFLASATFTIVDDDGTSPTVVYDVGVDERLSNTLRTFSGSDDFSGHIWSGFIWSGTSTVQIDRVTLRAYANAEANSARYEIYDVTGSIHTEGSLIAISLPTIVDTLHGSLYQDDRNVYTFYFSEPVTLSNVRQYRFVMVPDAGPEHRVSHGIHKPCASVTSPRSVTSTSNSQNGDFIWQVTSGGCSPQESEPAVRLSIGSVPPP